MIRHISGVVSSSDFSHVVVDVHGVGYLIYTHEGQELNPGDNVTFHTYHAVRENALELFGFLSIEELDLFMLLIELPKIGPKSAAQILSQANVDLLKTAVLSEDSDHLSKMSGIGKKTAEKIVSGLKDKFDEIADSSGDTSGGATAKTTAFASDAIDALIALGYPQSDARRAIQSVQQELPKIKSPNDAVKEALKILSG